jgi:hypothetical protein
MRTAKLFICKIQSITTQTSTFQENIQTNLNKYHTLASFLQNEHHLVTYNVYVHIYMYRTYLLPWSGTGIVYFQFSLFVYRVPNDNFYFILIQCNTANIAVCHCTPVLAVEGIQ